MAPGVPQRSAPATENLDAVQGAGHGIEPSGVDQAVERVVGPARPKTGGGDALQGMLQI